MAIPDLALVTKASVHEDTDITFLARVLVDASNTLTPAVQADISTITYAVYAGATSIGTGSVAVSSSVYNTLQTGTIWGVDSTGFNFKATLANTLFPTGSTTYTVDFKFTLASGNQFFVSFEVVTRDLAST